MRIFRASSFPLAVLFYILSVTRTRPRLDNTESDDPEIVIRAVMTNRYVCMDTRANVFTQVSQEFVSPRDAKKDRAQIIDVDRI